MATTNNIQKALALALKAHEEQLDKAGIPYVLHPINVMSRLDNSENHPHVCLNSIWMEKARIVALWHDIAEDTSYSIEEILNEAKLNLPHKDIRDIKISLQLMNHDKNESYSTYINKMIQLAKYCDGIPLYVKKADIEHNTLPERIDFMEESTKKDFWINMKTQKE